MDSVQPRCQKHAASIYRPKEGFILYKTDLRYKICLYRSHLKFRFLEPIAGSARIGYKIKKPNF